MLSSTLLVAGSLRTSVSLGGSAARLDWRAVVSEHAGANVHGLRGTDGECVGIERDAALADGVRFVGGVAHELQPEAVVIALAGLVAPPPGVVQAKQQRAARSD